MKRRFFLLIPLAVYLCSATPLANALPPPRPCDRLALHARRIDLPAPRGGGRVVVEAPLVPDLAALADWLDADGQEFTGPYYGEVSLATSIPIAGRLSIDPRVAYAFGLGDGKDAIEAVSVDGKGTSF